MFIPEVTYHFRVKKNGITASRNYPAIYYHHCLVISTSQISVLVILTPLFQCLSA